MPPIKRVDYIPLPFSAPRFTPDTRALAALAERQGNDLSLLDLQKGRNATALFDKLGELWSGYHAQTQAEKQMKAAMAMKERDRQDTLKEKDADRDERAQERAAVLGLQIANARQAQYDKQFAEAKDTVMDTAPGPISDTDPRAAVLSQLVERFPQLQGRFGTTPRLDARPVGGAPELDASAPPLMNRIPTGQEANQIATIENAKAAAAAVAARQAKTDARLEKNDAATQAYRMGMLNKPSGNAAGGGLDMAADIAEAIMRGEQQPDTQNMSRAMSDRVRGHMAKAGFNLNDANLDWKATQRHLTTLNGAQQTRLRQAIGTAAESLDVIQGLSDQWKGGRFPILNKANLALAKNGAYGKDAASIATQLEGQITDVTSELANAYMGGNSPTDHALQLAAKNLSADWDQKVLTDMIKLAKTNLAIRRNSIEQAGPITASSQKANTLSPSPSSGGTVRMIAPNGQEQDVSPDQVAHYKALGAKVKG